MASPTLVGPDPVWSPKSNHSNYFHAPNKHSIRGPRLVETAGPQHGGISSEFPASIEAPTAWSGTDLNSLLGNGRCCLHLDNVQIAELELASRDFEEYGYCLDEISQRNFLLPTLGKCLKTFAHELTEGVGFFRIRGLDPKRYSKRTNIIIYLGLTTYIGEQRGRQDEYGNMLLHLTDVGRAADPDNLRQAPYSNVEQPFHTDTGDIIALYSQGEAHSGGECRLTSTATIYNEIARTRPDILSLLSSPTWAFDRFGQWPPYTLRPLVYPMPDRNAILSFSRRPLVGSSSSPRSADVPQLSSSHIEALNIVQSIADRHSISMKLKPGDMLIWNNLALMHGRSAFTDSSANKRHLIRLWLRNEVTEKEWPIPRELEPKWTDAFEHAGRPQLWPLEPIRDNNYICARQRSSGHG